MRVAVVGAGAIGGWLGTRLAASGAAEVHVVARGEALSAIREFGLRLEDALDGDAEAAVHATDDAAEVGQVDAVLFSVKAYDAETAARQHLPALVADGGVVVPLLNGVEAADQCAAVVGADRVAGGIAYVFAAVASPGVVRRTGGPGRVVVGEIASGTRARLEQLVAVLRGGGVDAQVADDARRALWDKFAFIVAVSGLTAATRLPIGELRESPAAWSLFRRVVEEAYAVARASGVDVPAGAVDTVLSFAEDLPGQSRSSLYDDLAAGRRLEVDALQGAVVRIGAELGVPTPSCETLAAVLAPHAAGAPH
ncbi:MAG TPA: 2-dehydropantoate 2-reductase [Actinomycetales bacterium]|nr:2-dehydropantoate 2-reductase [Actinomycetales bacterium]